MSSYILKIPVVLGACCGLCVVGSVLFTEGYQRGVEQYHERCYNIGGIMIDEQSNKAVLCRPLGIIPKEELLNNGTLPAT